WDTAQMTVEPSLVAIGPACHRKDLEKAGTGLAHCDMCHLSLGRDDRLKARRWVNEAIELDLVAKSHLAQTDQQRYIEFLHGVRMSVVVRVTPLNRAATVTMSVCVTGLVVA